MHVFLTCSDFSYFDIVKKMLSQHTWKKKSVSFLLDFVFPIAQWVCSPVISLHPS